MSNDIWYRTRKQDDDLIILLKRFGWGKDSLMYYDHASYSSKRNRAKVKVVDAIQNLRKAIIKFVEEDDMCRREINESKGDNFNRYNLSAPMKMSKKDLAGFEDYCEVPDDSIVWEALNKQWAAKLGMSPGKKSTPSTSDSRLPRPRGERTIYTTAGADTLAKHRVEVINGVEQVDQVVTFKENRSSSGNNSSGKGEWKEEWRKSNPFDQSRWGSKKDYEKDVQQAWTDNNS